MRCLAIDIGTTFLKGAVLDLERGTLSHGTRRPMPVPLANHAPLRYELDPDTVVNAFRELVNELHQAAPEATRVVTCAQMHGMLLLGPDGKARTPLITWQDQRACLPHAQGTSCLDWSLKQLNDRTWHTLGREARPGVPCVTLPWFPKNTLQDALLVSLPDYILCSLSGATPSMEIGMAASTGLLDIANQCWHQDAITRLGLSGLRFPELTNHQATPYAFDGLQCHAPIGDHQAALLGCDLQPNELSINISTGSQVSALSEAFEAGGFQVRPYPHGHFLNTFTDVPAGRSLHVLHDLVTELLPQREHAWQRIHELVAAASKSELTIDLAFFQADNRSQGHIANIREDNLHVGSLFRAAFQSMADTYWSKASSLPGLATRDQLVFSGGIAQKQPVLRELIAERFGLPYRVCDHAEDTLLGLLRLAERFQS